VRHTRAPHILSSSLLLSSLELSDTKVYEPYIRAAHPVPRVSGCRQTRKCWQQLTGLVHFCFQVGRTAGCTPHDLLVMSGPGMHLYVALTTSAGDDLVYRFRVMCTMTRETLVSIAATRSLHCFSGSRALFVKFNTDVETSGNLRTTTSHKCAAVPRRARI